jgi:hypothetical protein
MRNKKQESLKTGYRNLTWNLELSIAAATLNFEL